MKTNPIQACPEQRRMEPIADDRAFVYFGKWIKEHCRKAGIKPTGQLCLPAVETGFGVRELQSLTISSFDFGKDMVTARAKYCKNRRKAMRLLKNKRASQLYEFLTNKLPKTRAFNIPSCYRTTAMLKADLDENSLGFRHRFKTR